MYFWKKVGPVLVMSDDVITPAMYFWKSDMENIFRGHQRCSRIDYSNSDNVFAVTICVSPRRDVFVKDEVNLEIVRVIRVMHEAHQWGVYQYCIMPDHIHLVVNAGSDGLSKAVKIFKGTFTVWWRLYGDGGKVWQPGYFDHRIRKEEGFREQCEYARQNPVRRGLVGNADDYRWAGQFAVLTK